MTRTFCTPSVPCRCGQSLRTRCCHGSVGRSLVSDAIPHTRCLAVSPRLQILALYGAIDRIDKDLVCRYVAGLQQPDGSFFGDEWGEVDTRFSFCSLATLSLLGALERMYGCFLPCWRDISPFVQRCNYAYTLARQRG
jgi:prenyltransferase beta subunit